MTETWHPTGVGEFDVVGVAVGTALVSGGLALVVPALAPLTVTLATLAWAGWLSLARQTPVPLRRVFGGDVRWAVASTAAGTGFFVFGPTDLASVRALLLALSLVPLWMVARRTVTGGR